ncbi:hypothetical protein AB0G60_19440 [Streptomyces angustmyceticus]|uniref:Lipocalin-like domain-containing protein n=1 Tax=Streptomyces angustmyceticus TaxID=285578 RepID=A0A5J4KZH0_9ACTN|nr:hypothetical protein [Streptomyces angustmyceticus]UAL65886.1 hypothetical protein K7396_04460 [Streptomyces angustmyceticus]GES27537.1 hypothetical protein San01_00230 [Streptomyces angustmyceticus]
MPLPRSRSDRDAPSPLPAAAGVWRALVRRPRETSTATFVLGPRGTAVLLSGTAGHGSWSTTDTGVFSYRITEPLIGADGRCTGWVDVDQTGVLRGAVFTSRGVSRVHDARGVLRSRVPVAVLARRWE